MTNCNLFLQIPTCISGLHDYDTAYQIGGVVYPLFYYQFPDFFPNFAIAYGISPPKSVIRRFMYLITLRPDPDGFPNLILEIVNGNFLRTGKSDRIAHRRTSEHPSFYSNENSISTNGSQSFHSDGTKSFVASTHQPSRYEL